MGKKQKRSVVQTLLQRLQHLLLPHSSNQYRPHAVRTLSLLMLLVALAFLNGGYNLARTGDVLGQTTRLEPAGLLVKTNATRTEHLRQPLRESPQLAEAAFLKAKDMFAKNYWAHEAPDGTKPWKWLAEASYNYSTAGENLARGFKTEEDVVRAWLDSPTHRSNLLNMTFQEVGFAVVDGTLEGKPTTLIVALYAAPADAPVAAATFNSAQSEAARSSGWLETALSSLHPPAFVSVIALVGLALIALLAHAYRHNLPEHIHSSWKRHHGVYKAFGLSAIAVFVVLVSLGGQI